MNSKQSQRELLKHLVNASEIARRANVGRPAVANWAARHPGFPEPVVRLLYDWREVETWLRDTGRYPVRVVAPDAAFPGQVRFIPDRFLSKGHRP